MVNIIGRKHEELILKKLFDSKKSEFPVIYGRRRIGKTYLIETYFTDYRHPATSSVVILRRPLSSSRNTLYRHPAA